MNNSFSWLNTDVDTAAQRLLGCEILSTIEHKTVRARIVEVEAYDQDDEASHCYNGETERNAAMFLEAGHLYVYLSYGIHNCCNIVCGPKGYGAGCLIRAVEPLEGGNIVAERRRMTSINATNGPGKVCQALGITLDDTGHDLNQPTVQLIHRPPLPQDQITAGSRIGISKAKDAPRRYYVTDSKYVPKKAQKA